MGQCGLVAHIYANHLMVAPQLKGGQGEPIASFDCGYATQENHMQRANKKRVPEGGEVSTENSLADSLTRSVGDTHRAEFEHATTSAYAWDAAHCVPRFSFITAEAYSTPFKYSWHQIEHIPS